MENTSRGEDSLTSSSGDQATNFKGWERFLPKRPLRVLVVEDDSSTRQIICALLSKCGYEVSCATDGSKAWELLEQSKQTFDLVLADAMMPVLSGTDLLVKIMSSDAHRDIPVIMMSAHDSLDMVFKCLLKGAKDFLVKPLRKNELRNLWQHVWRRNHAFGSQGDAHAKKRKASRNLSSGDISNDNFSVSSGIDAQNAHKDEKDAQFTGVCQTDLESKQSCPKHECNQMSSAKVTAQTDEHRPLLEQRSEFPATTEASEAFGTSAKAFDFFGTMTSESVVEHVSSTANLVKEIMTSSQNCQVLELTLRRTSPSGNAENDLAAKQGVRQSNCSAFSKYTSSTTQPCIVSCASLPNDQSTYGCGLSGNTPPSNDGPRPSLENCGAVNDRTMLNSTTLHFPKATHFQHGMQIGNSPFSHLPACCDEDSRQLQGNSSSNFKSPSINSSTANSRHPGFKENVLIGNVQLRTLDLQKEVNVSGSIWCSNGSDKEDFSSSNAKFGQLLPCSNADCMRTDTDKYGLYEHSNKALNVDGIANGKTDGSLHDLPPYTMVSGRGSNDCSDRGSSMLEEHMTGRSVECVAAQDGHSLSGRHCMNESNRMDMDSCGVHAHDESNASDQKPLVYDYRSSFREAALHKFREKRKMRCFEKKVRYQSRKKLAEQRPRVKGQFVRRATFESAAAVNTTS
ncbi:hypothetical protein GOP47_0013487 [Adiantum capillus-veneris]|uniref:Uncharacterized protein n=1 Tax=Adiantum capillus-veneris TaxID=13818 RepID=A0A9D4UPB1_ADICA|nr:hypothetical protein GOP47_0013487 [Adiantum capillus-veneris]